MWIPLVAVAAFSAKDGNNMTKKRYRVKVTEKHSDYVWVEAESASEAKDNAHQLAICEFECLYDCEVVGEEDLNPYGDSF